MHGHQQPHPVKTSPITDGPTHFGSVSKINHWITAPPVILLMLALHIFGALKHHFIDRDTTLRRMTAG